MKRTITLVCPVLGSPHTFSHRRTPFTSLIFKIFQKAVMPLSILLFAVQMNAQYCTMACHNLVQVSLPSDCEGEITYDMILSGSYTGSTCSPNGPSAFEVIVMDPLGQPIPSSPYVTASEVGNYWSVKVKHWASGNSCWGNILVEDKLAPELDCPDDVTVACTESTSVSETGTATADDCSTFDLDYYDSSSSAGCGTVAGLITRTWTAIDFYNNSSTCNQTITIAQPSTTDVVFPPNRDGITAPAVDCSNPDTEPSNTGFPTINGEPIANGVGFCNMAVDYNDQTLPLCDGGYKILRNWTVVYWCTGAILNKTQVIAVKDTHAPTLTCPPALNVGTTSSQFCKATVILPEVEISDNCSSTFSVNMNTPSGFISGNGGVIHDVFPGSYTITYNVTDGCGNSSACSTPLTVSDDDAPTVVCDEFTVVTLNSSGYAYVFAETFDDGSYDNCSPVDFAVRRMTAACGEQPVFGPTVKFCCEDVGDDVQVEMQVTDYIGNSNFCMVTVHVDDNSEPAILCPAPVTITCLEDPTDLSLTGEPTTSIACGSIDVTFSDVSNLNLCDVGTITRTWTATAGNGTSNSCTQTITLVDNTPVSVVWPEDYQANGCVSVESLAPDSLPAGFDFPIITEDCELMATNVSDQIFNVAPPACFKIVRTWTVMDWCNSQTVFTHNQIVMVYDDEAPTFTCPSSFTVGVDANCVGAVILPEVTDIQDCSQNVSVFVDSDFGSGYGPFTNVAPGTYIVNYFVADGCNNSSNCSITVDVIDDKKPTPYCKNGLIVEIMGVDTDGDGIIDDGMIETWAEDFNDGSFDNCPGALFFSFSSDVTNTGVTFDCDDIGQNPIQMWVTDAAGNQDYCETFILIQDNMGVCFGTPLMGSVGGAITNEMGDSMEDVEVTINYGGTTSSMTDEEGNFDFPALPLGGDFTVNPDLNVELLNGVTTFDIFLIRKHILGIEELDSPYKLIAADVNHSESITTADLLFLQKVILFVDDEFPNNESWRFVDAAYDFPNSSDPWEETFPEVYNINNFAGNMDDVDFLAVKVGDVNNTASTNFHTVSTEDRNGGLLALRANDLAFSSGEKVEVEVTAENFREVIGYQFTLNFDRSQIDFVEVKKGELASVDASNFGLSLLDEGVLTTSWNSFEPISLEKEAVLFTLVFEAKTQAELSTVLELTSDFTRAEAYHEDGELLDVELQFNSKPNAQNFELVLFPNPFTEHANLVFNLEKDEFVRLTVFDAAGRLAWQTDGHFAAGENQIRIDAENLLGAGTFFFRLENGEEVQTGSFVKK